MAVKNRQSRGIRYKTQTEQNQNKAEKKSKTKKSKKKKAKNKTKTKLKNSTEHKRKDSKWATRTPKENRQHNGQMNKDKKCDLQSSTRTQ